MNGYPDWHINSIPMTQPLESTTSVLSNDSSDEGQDSVRDTKPGNLPVRNPQ